MREYKGFVIPLDRSVAGGASDTFVQRPDVDGVFVAESMQLELHNPSTVLSTTLALTQFPPGSTNSPAATTGNSMPTLNFFRVQILINSIPLFSIPVSALLVFGTGDSPHYFQTKPVFSATTDVSFQIFNDAGSGFPVKGMVLFEGFKASGADADAIMQGRRR